MLFERRLRDGINNGSVTVAFRRWRRSQVVAGNRYRTGASMIEVDAVDAVDLAEITADDAVRAGYATPGEVSADLRGDAGLPLYRVTFHRLDNPDPRDELAHDADLDEAAVAELDRRLARADARSEGGPWTAAVLDLIARRPAVVAAELAQSMGLETLVFKSRVRVLKELGLTLSLITGYRLSPRGEAYLLRRG